MKQFFSRIDKAINKFISNIAKFFERSLQNIIYFLVGCFLVDFLMNFSEGFMASGFILITLLLISQFIKDNAEHQLFRKLLNPIFILKLLPYFIVVLIYTSIGAVAVYSISVFIMKGLNAFLIDDTGGIINKIINITGILDIWNFLVSFLIQVCWLLSAISALLVIFQTLREILYIICRRLIAEGKSHTFSLK